MGVKIRDIVEAEVIDEKVLYNKTLAVDAFNTLYQFLSTIRQPDGTPLQDKGGITSHLAGILYRITNYLEKGIRFIFVFDGKPTQLKSKTIESRIEKKERAKEEYEKAKEEGNLNEMRKYAMQNVRLTNEIISESKELLNALGCAVLQAEGEGESLASLLVKKDIAWAIVSQDYDSLLFGAKRVVRNLSVSKKRRVNGIYKKTELNLIDLKKNLINLGISREQLIVIGILCGTDFNPGGIPNIGAKKALKLVKEHSIEEVFDIVKWNDYYDFSWKEVFNIFNIKDKNISIEFPKVNEGKIMELLCEKHEFNRERVENAIKKIKNKKNETLNKWF